LAGYGEGIFYRVALLRCQLPSQFTFQHACCLDSRLSQTPSCFNWRRTYSLAQIRSKHIRSSTHQPLHPFPSPLLRLQLLLRNFNRLGRSRHAGQVQPPLFFLFPSGRRKRLVFGIALQDIPEVRSGVLGLAGRLDGGREILEDFAVEVVREGLLDLGDEVG
jgi:hypothetical protein